MSSGLQKGQQRLPSDLFSKSSKGLLTETHAEPICLVPKLHPTSLKNPQCKELKASLGRWVNNGIAKQLNPHLVLAKLNLHTTDLTNDMSDGQLFGALIEELTGEHIVEWETTTSEKGKALNMIACVRYLDVSLNIKEDDKWSRLGIYERDQSSTLALLVHISHAVGANLGLPANVSVAVIKSVNVDGISKNKTSVHKITGDEGMFAIDSANTTPGGDARQQAYSKDVFDGLVDSPEKLIQVTNLMTAFVNEQLDPMGFLITDLLPELEDGVKLLLLIGSVGNFYIPFDPSSCNSPAISGSSMSLAAQGSTTSSSAIQKLQRVKLAFHYMHAMGIDTGNFNPVDFVRRSERGVLRCLYKLFEKNAGNRS